MPLIYNNYGNNFLQTIQRRNTLVQVNFSCSYCIQPTHTYTKTTYTHTHTATYVHNIVTWDCATSYYTHFSTFRCVVSVVDGVLIQQKNKPLAHSKTDRIARKNWNCKASVGGREMWKNELSFYPSMHFWVCTKVLPTYLC